MKWTDKEVATLKKLCKAGKSNADIAKKLNRTLPEIYAKRSQLGITIEKCKAMQ